MKKVAITIALIAMFGFASHMDTTYTREATITNIEDNGIITVVDVNGDEWKFYNYGFHEGDVVKMVMDTNHTTNNKDDAIVEVY